MAQIVCVAQDGTQFVERCPRQRARFIARQLRRAGITIVTIIG